MELLNYFKDFLTEIRLTDSQVDDCITGHKTLRKRLKEYESLKDKIVNTFLQGSYRRSTAVRPANGNRADVDVVVVTNLKESEYPKPDDAIALFIPFLEKYYKGKYKIQNRSIAIELTYVDLDLVITSAPSESEKRALMSESVSESRSLEDAADWRLVESWLSMDRRAELSDYEVNRRLTEANTQAEWKLAPLRIPDRDREKWEDTHPIAQLQWTVQKNKDCNTHYVNVVKAMRWWKRINPDLPKYPKGYPLEHLIGLHCPDNISSVAEGVVESLESIVDAYSGDVAAGAVPYVQDHGVDHDVFGSVDPADFEKFYDCIKEAAATARAAYNATTKKESADLWRQLFGSKFPEAPDDENRSAYKGPAIFTPPSEVSQVGHQRYAQDTESH
jgi:predicted nucleotidyltransferase